MYAYFKERSTIDLVRATKDIIANAYNNPRENEICVLLSSDYSAAFDFVSRSHIFSTLELMGFPENIVNLIKNLYHDAKCKVLLNEVNVEGLA